MLKYLRLDIFPAFILSILRDRGTIRMYREYIFLNVVFELVTQEQPQSRAQGAAPAGMSAADPHPNK
jgi:hypothetical protein